MITTTYGCLTAVLCLCALPLPVVLSAEFVTNHWHVTLKEPLQTEQVRDLVKSGGFSVINQVSKTYNMFAGRAMKYKICQPHVRVQ